MCAMLEAVVRVCGVGLHSPMLYADQVRQPGSKKTVLELDAAAVADKCAFVVECKAELDSSATRQLIGSMHTLT